MIATNDEKLIMIKIWLICNDSYYHGIADDDDIVLVSVAVYINIYRVAQKRKPLLSNYQKIVLNRIKACQQDKISS